MANIKIVPILPKKKFLGDVDAIERALEAALDESADEALKQFERTTETWKTKVNFYVHKTKAGRTVGTQSRTYGYVDRGTRPHIIRVKRAKFLKFQGGYSAKTTPGRIGSKGGGPKGKNVFRKIVRHPGTTARGFTDKIGENMQKAHARIMRQKLKGLFKQR